MTDKKWDDLKRMYLAPTLYLDAYFNELRREVDLEYSLIEKEKDKCKWLEIIDAIKDFETEIYDNFNFESLSIKKEEVEDQEEQEEEEEEEEEEEVVVEGKKGEKRRGRRGRRKTSRSGRRKTRRRSGRKKTRR